MILTREERIIIKTFLQCEIKSLESLIRQMEKMIVIEAVLKEYKLRKTAYEFVLNDINGVIIEEIKGTENG